MSLVCLTTNGDHLDYLSKVVSSSFLHSKVILFPFVIKYFVAWYFETKCFSLEFQFIHLLYQYRFVVPILLSGYNLLSLFILMVRLLSVWLVDAPSTWLLYPFDLLSASLLSAATKMFQVHCVFSYTLRWDESVLQGALVTFSEEWYLNLCGRCG